MSILLSPAPAGKPKALGRTVERYFIPVAASIIHKNGNMTTQRNQKLLAFLVGMFSSHLSIRDCISVKDAFAFKRQFLTDFKDIQRTSGIDKVRDFVYNCTRWI